MPEFSIQAYLHCHGKFMFMLAYVGKLFKAFTILLPLLSFAWIIGLFAVNEETTVFAWLFVIFNSFQVSMAT